MAEFSGLHNSELNRLTLETTGGTDEKVALVSLARNGRRYTYYACKRKLTLPCVDKRLKNAAMSI